MVWIVGAPGRFNLGGPSCPTGGPCVPSDVHREIDYRPNSRNGNSLGEIRSLISPVRGNLVDRIHIGSVHLLEESYPGVRRPADAPGHCRRARAAGRKEEEQVCDPLIGTRHLCTRPRPRPRPHPTSTSHLRILTSSHSPTRPTESRNTPHFRLRRVPLSSPRLPPVSRFAPPLAPPPASRIPRSTRSRLDTDPSRI